MYVLAEWIYSYKVKHKRVFEGGV